MKEVLVLRHAEAEHLVSNIRGGTNETCLTENGRTQANLTGRRLASIIGAGKVKVYNAPSIRASETARIISNHLNAAPRENEALATLHDGTVEKETNPLTFEFLLKMPRIDWKPNRNAETWRSMHARVDRFMSVELKNIQDYMIIITHGVTHIAIVQWWIGLTAENLETLFFEHEVSPCGITRLSRNEWKYPRIITLNDVSHLTYEFRTKEK